MGFSWDRRHTSAHVHGFLGPAGWSLVSTRWLVGNRLATELHNCLGRYAGVASVNANANWSVLLPLRGLAVPRWLREDVRNAKVRFTLVGDFVLEVSATACGGESQGRPATAAPGPGRTRTPVDCLCCYNSFCCSDLRTELIEVARRELCVHTIAPKNQGKEGFLTPQTPFGMTRCGFFRKL
jgi:hypothetical protein